MKITIRELRQLYDILLERVKNVEGKGISFDENFYWAVDSIERSIITAKNPSLALVH